MAFPGGKSEKQDASLRHTAERETLEEIGLDLPSFAEHLGPLDEVQGRKAGQKLPFAIAPFVYWLNEEPELKPDPAEVAAVHWISLGHLLDPGNFSPRPREFNGVKVELPGIEWDRHWIWGLSYLMLQDLFRRMGELSSSATS